MNKYLPNYGVNCSDNVFVEYESLEPNDSIVIRECSDALFRFFDQPFDEHFLYEGKLRISPLSTYKSEINVSRADVFEGNASQKLNGINNNLHWIATDSYCLSFTRIPFMAVKRKYGINSRCIKIANTNKFLTALDTIVRGKLLQNNYKVTSSIAGEVAYCDFDKFSFGEYGCGIHQAFVKPHISKDGKNEYWIENEYRVIWDLGTASNNLEPIYIENSELINYLSRVNDVELKGDEEIQSLRVRAYTKEMHESWILKNTKL